MGITNKPRRRLCVLLVLIVSNYYLSLADSLDEVDSYVSKLQDKMSSCLLVKLCGLVSRRKKTRRLTLIEVYIWLSTMAFTQLLRSLIAHITALLLRAGDVELNPGPGKTQTPSDGSEAVASRIPNDTAQLDKASNTLSNPKLELKTPLPILQMKAQQETPQDHVQSPRKAGLQLPDLALPAVLIHETQYFQDQTDKFPQHDDLTMEHPPPKLSCQFPKSEQREPQPGESVPVIFVPDVHPTKAKEDADSHDDDRMHHQDFGELRKAGSCISLKEFEKMHAERIAKTIKTKDSISDDGNSWIDFIISANRLLRVGRDCKICPMCLKKPSEILSHVFPQGLLTVYRRIHCSNVIGEYSDFIYDFSRGVRMGSRALRYRMLCGSCEKLCDEKSLRELYIFLMDKPNKQKFKVLNDGSWLQRALVNIMLRGLMIADDLPNELQDDKVKEKFKALREFCKSDKSMPEFRLFLLPNQSIDEELIAFIYPFEYTLRSPMFSTVVRDMAIQDRKKIRICFIYTKFDCFHLVLPLDDKSEDYFNRFQRGFETYEHLGHKYVDLRWSKHGPGVYKREFNRETSAVQYSAPEEMKPCIFPELLLKIALHQYGRYLSMIYSHSKESPLTPHSKIMIVFRPGLNYNYPSKDFSGTTATLQK